jgi:polyhydroxyalkanoate synthesis regulator phasin
MIDQVRDTLRKASRVVDTPRRRTEAAVRKMAETPNLDLMDAPQLALEVLRRGRVQAAKARSLLDKSIRDRLDEMGLATKEEVDKLKRRIADLEAAAARPPRETTTTTAKRSSPSSTSTRSSTSRSSSASRPARATRARTSPPPEPPAGGESTA